MLQKLLLVIIAVAAIALGIGFFLTNVEEHEEMVAIVDYRSLDGGADGILLINVNPNSTEFGEIIDKYEVGEGVLLHHLYWNNDRSKLYNTALAGDRLYRVIADDHEIHGVIPIHTGDCQVGEDLYFTDDGSQYYMTCMGSGHVLVFDSEKDQIADIIRAPMDGSGEPFIRYPHGISANEGIDRMLVTETVSADLSDAGSHMSVIELSTGRVLENIHLSRDENAPGAPVEVFFHPTRTMAFATGMLDASLWTLTWDADSESFIKKLVDTGDARGESWPLEPIFGPDNKLYVSWAVPGVINIYDLADLNNPELIHSLPADPGAHHIDFTPDGHYMVVQNNLLNLSPPNFPELNGGTIIVYDLRTMEEVGRIDNLVDQGMMPESMLLMEGGHQH